MEHLNGAKNHSESAAVGFLVLVCHNLGVESTIILWRGRSLELVQCCRSFGPSTSRPPPDPR